MLTLSTATVARLQSVPWAALCSQVGDLDAALSAVLAGEAAERVVDRYLRAHKGFSPEERTAAVEAIFGVGLWRRRLRFHVGAGASARELLASLLRDVAQVDDSVVGGAPPSSGVPSSLADCFSLPDWLAQTLTRELGDEAAAFCDVVSRPGPICVRANALKTSRSALLEELALAGVVARPGLHAPHAVILEGRPNLLGLAAQQEGRFEAQDEGSQLLSQLVGAQPGERVLDLCAGAGGKALALAADLENRGELFAYDVDARRLDRLRQRASRAGVNCLRVLTPGQLPEALAVDRVLVDAPCSELGALRRGPDLRFRMDPTAFEPLPGTQAALLDQAARTVRPGGRLVYATCTLRREENQAVAGAFADRHPDFRRVPPACDAAFLRDGFFVALPHRHGTDGFFAAVFERA